MILHLYVADKFIPPFVSFVNDAFPEDEHVHYVINKKNRYTFTPRANLIQVRSLSLPNLVTLQRLFTRADKVILHGLFWNKVVRFLAVNHRQLGKCFWVIWGGDLHAYDSRHRTWTNRCMHRLRRFVISRLGHFITYLPGDYALARQWYGAKGTCHECLVYQSNVFRDDDHQPAVRQHDGKRNVLLGNSASRRNRHAEALRYLAPFKGAIRIHVPLTYGNQEYARQVVAEGQALFGDDFCPMLSHLPLEEYYRFLGAIDLVVFNQDRQQGMGNLVQLLGLGKKVYIDVSTSQKALFDSLGITVYDVRSIDLVDMDDATRNRNMQRIREYFSEVRFRAQWQEIFALPA